MRQLEIGLAIQSRITPTNKALQVQTIIDSDASLKTGRGGWGDVYAGSWCIVAPPATPTQDATGAVTGACEVAGVQLGDQIVALGQRDVRWSKFSQDAKPGEVAIFNAFGSRIFLGQNIVALNGGPAFLTFDIAGKKVGLAGYPASPGAGAPYLSLDTTSAGLVSATGGASVTAKNDQVTATGANANLDVGTVTLGKGASDFVALASLVLAALQDIASKFNSHTHVSAVSGSPTTPPGTVAVPIVITAPSTVASARVKSA